jgi:translation initiation factor 4A
MSEELQEETSEQPIVEPVIEIRQWDDLVLPPDLLRSIYSYGFENPSEIQKKAILPIMSGRDVIAQAQSGTGKTGAFTISTLSKIDVMKKQTQAVLLAPTHELAIQISSVVRNLSSCIDGIQIRTLLGGTSVQTEMAELKETPPHIVVGCTGRVFDMMKRGALNCREVKICVLDEADEMLSHGFKDQVYKIFQMLPSDVQIALFSATMPEPVMRISDKFMRDPVRIMMKPEELNLEGIRQFYIAVHSDQEKYTVLKDLFQNLTISQTIIYVNNVGRVDELCNSMKEEGFPVCCIHSNMTKDERKRILDEFRRGAYRVLISSNITARGIDVQQVSTVINFDVPRSVDTYLHRIGRSGRWGRKGIAINFVTKRDIYNMKAIEKHYNIEVQEFPNNFQFV